MHRGLSCCCLTAAAGQRKSKKWKQSVKIHPPAADGFNSVERWLVKEGSELFGRQVDNKVVW